jgi:hypothetical protein
MRRVKRMYGGADQRDRDRGPIHKGRDKHT